MPTYQNIANNTAMSGDPAFSFPAKSEKETSRYIRSLPPTVSLKSHLPLIQPWMLLGNISAFPSDSIDVASYPEVVVYALTTGPITLEANGDTENAILLPPGSYNTIRTSYLVGAIKILSRTGTGSVYVWGLKGELT